MQYVTDFCQKNTDIRVKKLIEDLEESQEPRDVKRILEKALLVFKGDDSVKKAIQNELTDKNTFWQEPENPKPKKEQPPRPPIRKPPVPLYPWDNNPKNTPEFSNTNNTKQPEDKK
jgi:hypothetical protein